MAESAPTFTETMAGLIESGLDDDPAIQYRHVEVEVTSLNGLTVSTLDGMDSGQIYLNLVAGSSVSVSSTIECVEWACDYLVNDYDDAELEVFVTSNLQSH